VSVDPELKKDAVQRTTSREGNLITVNFRGRDLVLFRVAVASFFDNLTLATRTAAAFALSDQIDAE
jgi:tRNA threonylcarbamoyladenosine modification (KEOPS) complex  Pcc1 subunit